MDVLMIVKSREQIEACVPRLRSLVRYWQLGNEPTNRTFTDEWMGKDISLDQVVQWYSINARRLKKLHPGARIVLNPNDLPRFDRWYTSWVNFYEALERARVPYDIVGVDSYPGGAYQGGFPSDVGRTIATAKKLGDKFGKPVWLVESGSPTFGRSEKLQANFVNDVVASAARAKADGIIIYQAFDEQAESEVTRGVAGSTTIESSFGLMTGTGQAKAAYSTLRRIIGLDRRGEEIPYTSAANWYSVLSKIYRQIMPLGGPLGFNDLVDYPGLDILTGFALRYALGKGIGSIKDLSCKEALGGSVASTGALMVAMDRFYSETGTKPLLPLAYAAHMIPSGLSILSGTMQTATFAAKDMLTVRRMFLTSLVPAGLAGAFGFKINMHSLLPLALVPLSTLAAKALEGHVLKKE